MQEEVGSLFLIPWLALKNPYGELFISDKKKKYRQTEYLKAQGDKKMREA